MWLTENTGCKKCHLGTITQLCRAISSQLRHISTIRKNLLSSNVSPTRPYNMAHFGPLAAEILLASLGHPCQFQRISCLGSITARHSSIGRQPNFAALNRGRHLYSAGRPSRWALAHILVFSVFNATRPFLRLSCTNFDHLWETVSKTVRPMLSVRCLSCLSACL